MIPDEFERSERMRSLVWSARVRMWRRAQSVGLAKIAFWLIVWTVLMLGILGLFLTPSVPGVG